MKVAQDKIVIPTPGETDNSTEAPAKPKVAGDQSINALAEASNSEAKQSAEDRPVAAEAGPASAAAVAAGSEDAFPAATTVGEGEDIFGAAKGWGNYLFGGVKDVTAKGSYCQCSAYERVP